MTTATAELRDSIVTGWIPACVIRFDGALKVSRELTASAACSYANAYRCIEGAIRNLNLADDTMAHQLAPFALALAPALTAYEQARRQALLEQRAAWEALERAGVRTADDLDEVLSDAEDASDVALAAAIERVRDWLDAEDYS